MKPLVSQFNTAQVLWLNNTMTSAEHLTSGGGARSTMESFLASYPAATGSNLGSAEILSHHCLVCGQYRDRTHLVLKQGISQVQLAVKA